MTAAEIYQQILTLRTMHATSYKAWDVASCRACGFTTKGVDLELSDKQQANADRKCKELCEETARIKGWLALAVAAFEVLTGETVAVFERSYRAHWHLAA